MHVSARRTNPPDDDLDSALATIMCFQATIEHADRKAAILLAFHAGIVSLAAGEIHTLSLALQASRPVFFATALLAVMFVVSVGKSLACLATCLRPQLTGPAGRNRFAFPNLAAEGGPPLLVSAGDQRDEAWRTAMRLARIALDKHHAVRSSMPWLAATGVVAAAWLCLAGFVSPPGS